MMSFSAEVKEELSTHISKSRHCQIAEFAGIFVFCGHIINKDGQSCLNIRTENLSVASACAKLINSAFGENTISFVGEDSSKKGKVYLIEIRDYKKSLSILKAIKFIDDSVNINELHGLVDNRIIKLNCCKRAFIRGAFLASGSISDPQKFYHFEVVCQAEKQAEHMKDILNNFGLGAKIVLRKNHFVVYIKEGDKIVDVLNIMEAHKALMNLENVRIMKEMRNNVNRQVNCEAANINKTVSAAVKQTEDINYLSNTIGLEALPHQLREIACLRLENEDATLKELGNLLNPQVGKSGVNHRLRRISALADEVREKKGGFI